MSTQPGPRDPAEASMRSGHKLEDLVKFRKRGLPITVRAKKILTAWMPKSKSDLVFTREDGITPVSAFTLIQQQERRRN